jgi:hypothetical protein
MYIHRVGSVERPGRKGLWRVSESTRGPSAQTSDTAEFSLIAGSGYLSTLNAQCSIVPTQKQNRRPHAPWENTTWVCKQRKNILITPNVNHSLPNFQCELYYYSLFSLKMEKGPRRVSYFFYDGKEDNYFKGSGSRFPIKITNGLLGTSTSYVLSSFEWWIHCSTAF